MRIHSDILTLADIYSQEMYTLEVSINTAEHGSSTHKRAFEVSLEGNGYRKNTGRYGADSYVNGATWDEWGVFLARLFDKDPNARCGSAKSPTYRDGYDFHAQTNDRFIDLELPADTHKRHTFRWDGIALSGRSKCVKCSAMRIWSY